MHPERSHAWVDPAADSSQPGARFVPCCVRWSDAACDSSHSRILNSSFNAASPCIAAGTRFNGITFNAGAASGPAGREPAAGGRETKPAGPWMARAGHHHGRDEGRVV